MAVEQPTLPEAAGWAEELEGIHTRIGPRFVRSEPRRQALAHLRRLLSSIERKNG